MSFLTFEKRVVTKDGKSKQTPYEYGKSKQIPYEDEITNNSTSRRK
jgi:hypothetical protein